MDTECVCENLVGNVHSNERGGVQMIILGWAL
jgi:hypothetical protein